MPPQSSASACKLFPRRHHLDVRQLRVGAEAAIRAQQKGVDNGKRPFAAILLAPDGHEVLLRQLSLSHFEHAESEICRAAAAQFKPEYLWQCTLISTWEPCAMCAGTLYWSNIGTLVYLASEKALQDVIGKDNEENMTMDLPCREVFAKGQKDIRVVGPLDGSNKDGEGLPDYQFVVCQDAFEMYWREQRGIEETGWLEWASSDA